MKIEIVDHKIFNGLNPVDIEKYLRTTGWRLVRREDGDVSIWETRLRDETFRIWLPLNRNYGDFAESMKRLVRTIAMVENRSQLALIEDLDTIGIGDVLRLRSFDEFNRGSTTLPLNDGLLLLNQGREMLNAAARSVIEKREVYPSRRPSQVSKYLRNLKLGQTEQGSYIVKLISPISDFALTQMVFPNIDMPVPFERKVVIGLMKSLNALNEAANETFKRGRFYFEVFREIVSEGVSANLCEAVTSTDSERKTYRPLEISVTWSYALENSLIQDAPQSIEISPNVMSYIEQAGRLFREKNPEEVTLTGYVIMLKRRLTVEPGEITLVTIIEGRQRNVRVKLDREMYGLALQAHENELKVSVDGELVKKGRLTFLEKPRNLQIIRENL